MMPKWLVESAIEKCKQTLAGNSEEPMSVRVRKMTQAFAKFGVTASALETYLEHKLDDVVLDELVDLTGIFNAIKDGAKASDYFGTKEDQAEASAATANKLAESAKAGATKATRKPPAASNVAVQQESKTEEKPSKPVEESAPVVSEVSEAAPESSGDAPEDDNEIF